jgi:hypothetical protein
LFSEENTLVLKSEPEPALVKRHFIDGIKVFEKFFSMDFWEIKVCFFFFCKRSWGRNGGVFIQVGDGEENRNNKTKTPGQRGSWPIFVSIKIN